MISFVNFARVASICVGFHLGTLQGYFFHQDFWPNLNFPLEYQIIIVLISIPHCSFAVNNLCLVSWKALAKSELPMKRMEV